MCLASRLNIPEYTSLQGVVIPPQALPLVMLRPGAMALVAFVLGAAPACRASPAWALAVAQPDDTPPAMTAEPLDSPKAGPQANESPTAATPDASPQAMGTAAMEAPAPGAEASEADPQPVGPPAGTAAQLAQWVAATGDNGGQPFVIVDKLAADVFVFAPDGSLQGSAPVLVGQTPGDDSATGVGDRDLSAISPEERTTPAGRFVASFGPASGRRTVLWVDYATAISLHPVIVTNPQEHRLERLRSPLAEDRRITYGCINVPTAFYQDVVLTAFAGGSGVVYILPETKPLQDVLPAFAIVANASATASGRDAADAPRQAGFEGQEEAAPSAPVSTAGADNWPAR